MQTGKIELSKVELRKLMKEFNTLSNRLLSAEYAEYPRIIEKFYNFIEQNPVIRNYIDECGGYQQDIEQDFNEILKHSGTFQFSVDSKKEISEIYSVIKLLCSQHRDRIPPNLLFRYSSSSKIVEQLKGFNHRVIAPFIYEVDDYLGGLGIEMGMDDNVNYNISGGHVQVNIANDNGTVNAVQNNNDFDVEQFKSLINDMKNQLSADLSENDRKEAIECISEIEEQVLSKQTDKNAVIKNFKLLTRIDSGVKFLSACASVATFIDRIYPYVDQIGPYITNMLAQIG